jgi:hypothetical protein
VCPCPLQFNIPRAVLLLDLHCHTSYDECCVSVCSFWRFDRRVIAVVDFDSYPFRHSILRWCTHDFWKCRSVAVLMFPSNFCMANPTPWNCFILARLCSAYNFLWRGWEFDFLWTLSWKDLLQSLLLKFTHSWSWALLAQLLRNFRAFYATQRYITVFTRALYWCFPQPDQSNPYHPF